MTGFRVKVRRTEDSGPPDSLEFGELAYSDADTSLHVGRQDGSIHTLALVPGPQGEPGPAGADGAPGPAGADGAPAPVPYSSPTPPPTPTDGEIWIEVDADGYEVERWQWRSGLARWVSANLYEWGGRRDVFTTSATTAFESFPMPQGSVLIETWSVLASHNPGADAENYRVVTISDEDGNLVTGLIFAAESVTSNFQRKKNVFYQDPPLILVAPNLVPSAPTAVGSPPTFYHGRQIFFTYRRVYG